MIREEELDDKQYMIKVMKMDDYLIEGCAGSGKTILALQKAKEIQDMELGSYLVVVYTLTLKAFIKDGITSLELDPDRVCNFHSLEKNGFDSADYIIVDEIQDFPKEEIEKLKKMAKKNFIFFGDDAQQIYEDKNNNITLNEIKNIGSVKEENYKVLENNYRLPKPIAEFAQQITEVDNQLAERCTKVNGEKPSIIKFDDVTDQLSFISSLIENEAISDVGILVGNNKDVEFIKDYFESVGYEAEYKYYEYKEDGRGELHDNLDFYTSLPKVMTYHSSKGLQFENVFMPLCEYNYISFNLKEAMYVAATRASQRLIILYSDKLSPFITNVNQTYYNYSIK